MFLSFKYFLTSNLINTLRLSLGLFIALLGAHSNAQTVNERLSLDEFLERLGSADNAVGIRLPSIQPRINADSVTPAVRLDGGLEPTPFIIGGTTAPRNRYPEYVLVLITNTALDVIGACGGTMIAANKVLTAAHCSGEPAGRYFLVPGFYSFNDSLRASDLFTVSRVAVHPDYNPTTFANDTAVMTLSRSFTGSVSVSAVLSGNDQLVGETGTVIGTGLTSTNPERFPTALQEVSAPITTNSSCNNRFEQIGGIRPIEANMVCAGFITDARGACSGDSGGPLFVEIQSQRVISGSVSFGFEQCEINRATSVYARMTAFTDFIRSESPNTVFITSNSISLMPIMNLLLDDGATGSSSGGGSSPISPPTNPEPDPGTTQDFGFPDLPPRVASGSDLVVAGVGDENDTIVGQTPKVFQLNSPIPANRAQMAFQDIGLDEVNVVIQVPEVFGSYQLWLRTQQANFPFPDLEATTYDPAAPIGLFSDDSIPSATFENNNNPCQTPRDGSFTITRIVNTSANSGLNVPVITETEGFFEVSCADDNGRIRGRFRYRR